MFGCDFLSCCDYLGSRCLCYIGVIITLLLLLLHIRGREERLERVKVIFLGAGSCLVPSHTKSYIMCQGAGQPEGLFGESIGQCSGPFGNSCV